MSKAITTIEQAISRYFDAVGEGALWPRINDCYETKMGTFVLKNTQGRLAVVTRNGAVLDRIGGRVIAAAMQEGCSPTTAVIQLQARASAYAEATVTAEHGLTVLAVSDPTTRMGLRLEVNPDTARALAAALLEAATRALAAPLLEATKAAKKGGAK